MKKTYRLHYKYIDGYEEEIQAGIKRRIEAGHYSGSIMVSV